MFTPQRHPHVSALLPLVGPVCLVEANRSQLRVLPRLCQTRSITIHLLCNLARVKGVAAAPGCSRTPVFSNGPYQVTPHLTSSGGELHLVVIIKR